MKSQIDSEIDEEYLDDPIKIINIDNFDNSFIATDHQFIDAEIVDFGLVLESEEENRRSRTEMPPSRACSLAPVTLSKSHNAVEQELCQTVSVKIVDCVKYPWFYKKYTTQIIKEIDDNTQDIIVVDLEDSTFNDFRNSGVEKMNSNLLNEEVKCPAIVSTGAKNDRSIKSRYTFKKLKQPQCFVLDTLSKQKNTTKIDFKKNQGLIGLKITHKKSIHDKTADEAYKAKMPKDGKKRESELCESYVEAIDKVLSNIGTSITPIVEAKDKRLDKNKILLFSKDNSESSNSRMNIDNSKATQKSVVSVKCTLQVTSPKILENINKKEDLKHTARETENQLTCSKKISIDPFSKKGTNLGSKSEFFKLASKAYIYNNTPSTNDNTNIIQKPMPKSKKTKAIEEYRNISHKTKETNNDSTKKYKQTGSNEIASCYSPITLKPMNNINSLRDISQKTKVNNPTDIRTNSLQNNYLKDILKTHSKADSNGNNETGLEALLIQKNKDYKILQSQLGENKLANNSMTKKQGTPTNRLNTTSPYIFDRNVKIKPQRQENCQNIKDAKRKHMLQIISIDNLNNFDNYIRIMRNKGVNHKVNSSVIEPFLSKTSSATVTFENSNNFNNKLSTTNIPETKDIDTNTNKKKTMISIHKPKISKRVSAIILRPTQQSQYQIGHNVTGPLVQTHLSNRFQHQRTVPPASHQMFSNTVEPLKPRLPFNMSTRPQLQGSVPPVPHQMFTNASVPTRYQMSPQQLPPFNQGIYHQPYNCITSSMRNGDPKNVVTPTGKHALTNIGNPNSYWFYGYPPPPPPPPPPHVPKSINQPSSQINNNSVIGMNNDGWIKKINITTGLLKEKNDSSFKLEDISMGGPDFKPIATKMEMLNELSKPIMNHSPVKNDLKRQFSSIYANEYSIKHQPTQRPGPLSKRFKLDPRASQTISDGDETIRKQTLANKGYSPPILPIPTYQKLLTQSKDSPKVDKPTNQKFRKVPIKTTNTSNKDTHKTVYQESNKNKEDLKKISLQEYKKRIPRYNNKNLTKQDVKKFANDNGKQNNAYFGTQHSKTNSKYSLHAGHKIVEDLGYDSDTTVKL